MLLLKNGLVIVTDSQAGQRILTMARKVIDIALDDIKSIKHAEKQKSKLENDGWKLVY